MRFKSPKHIDAYFCPQRDSWVLPVIGGHETLIDEQDRFWVREYSWFLTGNYVARSVPLLQQAKLGSSLALHRQIVGKPGLMYVDHINGDTLDNRSANLRCATPSQNCANSRKSSTAKVSRYKGVYKSGKRWAAKITARGFSRHLGTFDTEEQAAKAYDKAAKRLFEKFAKTNADMELL